MTLIEDDLPACAALCLQKIEAQECDRGDVSS